MDPVIELDGLEVRFGQRVILKKLKAALTGRSVGLLGPNGAGKSTLINTLLGFHKPSAGTARILGRDIRTHAREVRSLVGYMPENDAYIASHDRRPHGAADGGTGRPAARARPGTRARGILLRRAGRSALPRRSALIRWA